MSVSAKSAAPARRGRVAAPAPAPKVSKDDLRAQIETLTAGSEKMRARLREANKAAKAAASRIAELEEQVAQHEQDAAARTADAVTEPEAEQPRAKGRTRTKKSSAARDPGDAVPPGVAVEEPQPLDEEAEAAKHGLETHLAEEPVGQE